jgi:tricorn protease
MRLLSPPTRRLRFALTLAVCLSPALAHAQAGAVVRTPPAPALSSSAFLHWPDIHGDRVVFTAEGDLWLGSITDGSAERLTAHPGVESRAHFSPDGEKIAFNGQYDGASDVYVMPTVGGSPVRLTYDAYRPAVIGWSPDGTNVLYKSSRRSNIGTNSLFQVKAGGGAPVALPIPQVEQASMNADGTRIAYVPVSADWQHWYRYKGGEADHLWLTDTKAHTFKRLGDFDGIDKDPVWVGDTVYFISQRSGVPNLWRIDPATGKAAAVTHYRVTAYGDTKASYTDYEIDHLSTDGKRLIFEHGQGLALYDPADNQTRELRFRLASDRIHARPRRVTLDGWINSAALGPTGKRLAITARGQLLSAPVKEGDFRQLAPMPGTRTKSAAWSPDGTQVAFVSDRSGEEEIWLTASAAGKAASSRDKPR